MTAAALANYPLERMVQELAALDAEDRAAAAAEKEAKEHRKAVADRLADHRERIRDFLIENGVMQDTTPLARLSITKTPPKLKVDDPDAIPEEFFELEPSRNDAKIKARIASGISVLGARLEQSETLKVEWKK